MAGARPSPNPSSTGECRRHRRPCEGRGHEACFCVGAWWLMRPACSRRSVDGRYELGSGPSGPRFSRYTHLCHPHPGRRAVGGGCGGVLPNPLVGGTSIQRGEGIVPFGSGGDGGPVGRGIVDLDLVAGVVGEPAGPQRFPRRRVTEERLRHPSLRWSRGCRDESRGCLPPLLWRLGKRKVIPEPIDKRVGIVDVRARDPNITREKLREGWFG